MDNVGSQLAATFYHQWDHENVRGVQRDRGDRHTADKLTAGVMGTQSTSLRGQPLFLENIHNQS